MAPVLAGVLAGNVALAEADEPPPLPTPPPNPTATPVPASLPIPGSLPIPLPLPDAEPPAIPPADGQVMYVTTVTTTTTSVNAPITVVAAPITTTTNNTSESTGSRPSGGRDRDPVGGRFVIDMAGCGAHPGRAPASRPTRVRHARVQLARDATLVVRVNGRPITAVRLPTSDRRHARGVALRLRLARNGTLTIRRPSSRLVRVQGCTAP